MSGAPRVVFDTNLVLSALFFVHGRLVTLRNAWHESRCLPLVSRVTVTELMRALTYPKFKLLADEQRELLADYLPFCETVRMTDRLPRTPECRDPNDVPFVQLAFVGKADCLVSGDRDLLAIADMLAIPILKPEEFISRFDLAKS